MPWALMSESCSFGNGGIILIIFIQIITNEGVLGMGDNGTNYCNVTEDRKTELIKIIEKTNDAGTIEYLHTFVKLFMEKWG